MTDFRYLSLGAGVQSGTIAEMIAEGELDTIDAAIFADTGDEPQYVYDYLEYLRGRLEGVGVPLVVVNNGNIVKDLMTEGKRFAAIPAFALHKGKARPMRRQCTREYKIEPIEKYVRHMLLNRELAKQSINGAIRVNKNVLGEGWQGISLDEVRRMKMNPLFFIDTVWPLIDKRMTRHDCKMWLQRKSLPIPHRSSCRICPFHSTAHFRNMRDNHPDDWQHVVDFDIYLRTGKSKFVTTAPGILYLNRTCVPMNEVDLSTPQDAGQLELWDVCDEGYCFV